MKIFTKVKVYGVAGIALFGLMNNPFNDSNSEVHSLSRGEIHNSLDAGPGLANPSSQTPVSPQPAPNAPPALNGTGTSFNCRDFEPNVPQPKHIANDTFQAIMCAESITGVDAGILRGISAVECGDGNGNANDSARPERICRDPGTSNGVGASGPMQFLPCTWDNIHKGRNGCWNGSTSRERAGQWHELTGPAAEAGRAGHGADGNGDGIADPWDVYDSALASAIMVKNSFNGTQDMNETLQQYNGGSINTRDSKKTRIYAQNVLDHAAGFNRSIGR